MKYPDFIPAPPPKSGTINPASDINNTIDIGKVLLKIVEALNRLVAAVENMTMVEEPEAPCQHVQRCEVGRPGAAPGTFVCMECKKEFIA